MNPGWYIIIALLWIILGWFGWISAAKMFYDKPVTWRMRLAFILAGSITLIVWSCIVIALGLLIVLCALIEPMTAHPWLMRSDRQLKINNKNKDG